MKVAIICGSHPRNQMLTNALSSISNIQIKAQVIVQREELIPQPPGNLTSDLVRLWNLHFDRRAEAESAFFKIETSINKHIKTRIVHNQLELNSEETAQFLIKQSIDACFITGVPIIKDPLFSRLPDLSVNLHLGLIPDYKGSITMFWPFYMLEPAMAGCTYHFIGRKVDTGSILHQVCPKLEFGDGMHIVAAKASIAALNQIDLVTSKIKELLENELKPVHDPKLETSGKLFKKSDFSADKLRVIYDLYDDKIVDYYLSGEIHSRTPQLIKIN